MTTRGRLGHLAAFVVLAFIARWIHLEYRAPSNGSEAILRYVVLGVAFAIVATIVDSPPRTRRTSTALISAGVAALIGMGVAATSQLFFPNSLPRFTILMMALLAFVWLAVSGTVSAWRLRHGGEIDRVVAVLSESDANELAGETSASAVERPFVVAATVTASGDYGSISELCTAERAAVLVLGAEALLDSDVIRQAETLHRDAVRVRSLDAFYDERFGKLPISSLDNFALMGDIETLHGSYAPLKRTIDLLLAAVGALVLLVLLPFVLVGNLLANRGSLLFRQQRAGRFGEPFDILKLRTMAPGAVDISGWTSNNDPRITGFGKLLRRTHIDELPQVWNILIGELSIVGPRPEQITYVRQLEQSLPFYSARHLVRPGLTGWAQVKYPYAASEEDAYVKLQYDLYYVRHESFATDARIIALTIKHVLVGGGR